jgi:cytosine/adenosine deaminase-related metal-dependent hydrolase
VAFGLDSLAMNDDDDMLQDLRFSQLIHNNLPGIDSTPIPSATMLTMATGAGAAVADIDGIGSLAVGNHADIVSLSLPDMEGVPTGHSLADVLLKRAKGVHVRSVMVGGKLMIEDGRWTGRTPEDLLDMLRANAPASPPQPPRIALQLKDVVRTHLRTY